MRAYNFFNRIVNYSLVAFIVASVLILLSELMALFGGLGENEFFFLLSDISSLLLKLVPYAFAYFITISCADKDRLYRAFYLLFCIALFSAIAHNDINILLAVAITLGANYIFNHFGTLISYSSVIVITIILAFMYYYLSDYISDGQMLLADIISHSKRLSSFLYGFVSAVFNTLTSHNFDELFYYRSYGGSLIVGNELITGVKDMAQNGYSGAQISKYMSGHYCQLFALGGVALSLSDELKGSQKITMLTTFTLSIISGDIRLALLFIFLESFYLGFAVILTSGVCYLIADMLDISIPFAYNGGLIELILNLSAPVYLISTGLVFTAIGYFLTRLISAKYGLSDCYNIYIPTRLNTFVDALGGIANIVKIDDNVLEVRNPKLINTFVLDCVINENSVKTDDKRLNDLKDYL